MGNKNIPVSSNIEEYLSAVYDKDWFNAYKEYITGDHSETIRVNDLRISPEKLGERLLRDYKIETTPLDGIGNALRLEDPSNLAGKTLEHIMGLYYIQSLSSMIPPLVLDPQPTEQVLDMCSAPGSKSTMLSQMMRNRGTLICNEADYERAKSLIFNIDRTHSLNAAVTNYKGEQLPHYFYSSFDKVLVDAPCSGLGILHKKGEVSKWWNRNRMEALAETQYKLLVSAVKCCKPGGIIVYSTCTLTLEENEKVVDRILKRYPVEVLPFELPVASENGFTVYGEEALSPALAQSQRMIPWQINSEGFFVVKLRKTGEFENPLVKEEKLERIEFTPVNRIKKNFQILEDYFGIPTDEFLKYKYMFRSGDYYFLNDDFTGAHLPKILKAGSKLGAEDKYGNFILSSAAAQFFGSSITKNIIEINNLHDLTVYMQGLSFKVPEEFKGYRAVKYKGFVLGTAAVSEGKAKSRFPRSFRTQRIQFPDDVA
ncbi:MAG: NOL1/NOP2/sun family putative RNA methylase [Ignavibacteriaceae bacterium]|nr:NOL1/NOP2/sun family putative RNA methylase [Ignavibacteriaceae bacterium]